MIGLARTALAYGVWALVTPAAAQAEDRLPKRLAAMTPDDFATKTIVRDDPLESNVVLSTEKAFRGRRSVENGVVNNAHIRALVDRRSGATRFEIWHDVAYWGARKDIYQVNYLADGALTEAGLILTVHQGDDCPPVDAIGSCILHKRLAFEVPEAVVQEIAGQYTQESRLPWAFRFKDRHGKDITSGLAPAEASGLLRALDDWRNRVPTQRAES